MVQAAGQCGSKFSRGHRRSLPPPYSPGRRLGSRGGRKSAGFVAGIPYLGRRDRFAATTGTPAAKCRTDTSEQEQGHRPMIVGKATSTRCRAECLTIMPLVVDR